MATELKRKLDYDDYARLPDDGKRHEILDGELYVTPAPSPSISASPSGYNVSSRIISRRGGWARCSTPPST